MFGVQFTEADISDKHHFKVNVSRCNCGNDQKLGRNITEDMLYPLPHKGADNSIYYPGNKR